MTQPQRVIAASQTVSTHKFSVYILDASDTGAFERRQFHLSTHKVNTAAII
ncbi:hypothetical protein BKA93DRAFT_735727 [Sparassis latifolia]